MAAKNSVTLRLGTEGAEQVTAKLREIGETASREFTRTGREAQQASRGFETLERRLDPLVKANHDLAQAQAAATRAVEAGVRSHQDAARVVDLAAERHRRLTQGLGDNAKAAGLARHEWVNLGRQMTDVGTSLAGGASPFMVLTQQGGQIADVSPRRAAARRRPSRNSAARSCRSRSSRRRCSRRRSRRLRSARIAPPGGLPKWPTPRSSLASTSTP